jgi:hypothetical protein
MGCLAQDKLQKLKQAHCMEATEFAAAGLADCHCECRDGQGGFPPTLFLLYFTAKLYKHLFLM